METEKIRVIGRAFSILGHLARERRPLGVTEIAAAVSLPKATVYRILDSLESERAVMNRGGEYELGPVTLLLADAYRRQVGFAEAARPYLLSLRNETMETVHLFVYEGESCITWIRSKAPTRCGCTQGWGARLPFSAFPPGRRFLRSSPPKS